MKRAQTSSASDGVAVVETTVNAIETIAIFILMYLMGSNVQQLNQKKTKKQAKPVNLSNLKPNNNSNAKALVWLLQSPSKK